MDEIMTLDEPVKERISVAELVRRVKQNETIEDAEIFGELNHSTLKELIHYDPKTDERSVKCSIVLKRCVIGDIDLRNVDFLNKFEIRNCTVSSAVFAGTKFMKGANFSTTAFQGGVSFYKAWFYFTVYLSDTRFASVAEFGFVVFAEWAIFHNAYFMNGVGFSSATFKKRALFGNVKSPRFDFEFCTFEEWMKFRAADGLKPEQVDFSGCRFYGDASIRVSAADYLDLSDATSKSIIEIEGDFDKLNLINFSYDALSTKPIDLLSPSEGQKDRLDFKEDLEYLRQIQLALKINAQKLGMRDEEDFHYRELRRTEALMHRAERRFAKYFVERGVLDGMFGYGTAPQRAFLSSIGLVLLYALTYALAGVSDKLPSIFSDKFALREIGDYLYFSLITFATVGYGDISPTGIAKLIAATEGFLGVFMMSAFAVTFARKLLR